MSTTSVEYVNKTIYQVTSRLKLKHQIKLGRKNQKGDRLGPIFKYDYESNSYGNGINLSSITMDTSDYLILEYKDKEGVVSIYFSYPHLYNFKRFLKESLRWFYDDEYEKLFFEKNGELKKNAKFKELRLETDITIDSKPILIKPYIVERNDIYEEGVLLILNNEVSITLDVSELESLYDVFSNFDLYQNSLAMVNYVLTSYPEELLHNLNNNFSKKEKIPTTDAFSKKRVRKK